MALDPAVQLDGLRRAAEFFKIDVPEFVLPDERHALADRTRIHFLDWGRPGKRQVLLVHGTGLTAHTWDLAALNLRADYHLRAMDLRGHGESEWSPAMHYGVEDHASDIGALVETLGLQDFVLVGMSLGGLASLAWAVENHRRLAAFVMVDVAPGMFRPGTRRIGQFIQRQDEHDDIEGFVKEALAFNPRRDPDLLRVSLQHNLRQLADGKWTWKYDRRHHGRPGGNRGNPNLMKDLREGAAKLSCPTLILRGAESDVLHAEDAQTFASEIPQGRWAQVEGAGHTVQGDNPSGFASALRGFLTDAGL